MERAIESSMRHIANTVATDPGTLGGAERKRCVGNTKGI